MGTQVVAVFANIREIQQLHANLAKELRDAQGGAENGPFTHVFVKYVRKKRGLLSSLAYRLCN